MQHHSRLEEQQRSRHQSMSRSRSVSVSVPPFNGRDAFTSSQHTTQLPSAIPVSDSTNPEPSSSSVAGSQSDIDGSDASNYSADPDGSLALAQSDTKALTSLLLQHACELELHARRLLIHYLPDGSKAEVVLKADRNVQVRDVKAVRAARKRAREMARNRGTEEEGGCEMSEEERQHEDEEVGILAGLQPKSQTKVNGSRTSTVRIGEPYGGADGSGSNPRYEGQSHRASPADHHKSEAEQDEAFEKVWDELTRPMTDEETMEEVRKYRESFAAVLAVGSRLRKVEGLERLLIERRR